MTDSIVLSIPGISDQQRNDALLERDCAWFGLPACVHITARRSEEHARLPQVSSEAGA